MTDKEDFVEIEFIRGDYRVVWEYIGEGWSGDYNPEDPSDTPLLRFSCSRREVREIDSCVGVDEWEELPDSSYCTRMPATTSMHVLAAAAAEIMEAVYKKESYKRQLEHLSWMAPGDFRVGIPSKLLRKHSPV